MKRPWIVAAGLVWAVAGCQSSQQTSNFPPSHPAPTPPRVAEQPAQTPAVDPHVAEVMRQADEQAKAIDQVPVTRVTDPKKPATTADAAAEKPKIVDIPPKTPPEKSPGVGAVESAIAGMPAGKTAKPAADDGFRPVPAIVGPDGKPFQPTITPPGSSAAAPGTPTAEPVVANVPTPGETPSAVEPVPAVSPALPPSNANDPLGQQLAKKARDYPRDLAPQIDDQLYRMLNGEQVPTSDAMAGLSLEDRDILSSILDGMANFRGGVKKDANLLVTRKIKPILEMSDRLRSRADMSIVNANVCRKITAFGIYDPIIPANLRSGIVNKLWLYYEVENLNPRLDGNNNWVTPFQQDLVLYDEYGQPQWSLLGVKSKDECRARRRAFLRARWICPRR
ncbi:MAG: hypothetical protein QM754_11380 [Tepidisphaeraceae bacterium]